MSYYFWQLCGTNLNSKTNRVLLETSLQNFQFRVTSRTLTVQQHTLHLKLLIWSFGMVIIRHWYIGFHLSATVTLNMPRANYNVAVTFDRQRISSCNCTCSSTAHWCSHIVAVCLYRIHLVSVLSPYNRILWLIFTEYFVLLSIIK